MVFSHYPDLTLWTLVTAIVMEDKTTTYPFATLQPI
jgi:hypothetical protein